MSNPTEFEENVISLIEKRLNVDCSKNHRVLRGYQAKYHIGENAKHADFAFESEKEIVFGEIYRGVHYSRSGPQVFFTSKFQRNLDRIWEAKGCKAYVIVIICNDDIFYGSSRAGRNAKVLIPDECILLPSSPSEIHIKKLENAIRDIFNKAGVPLPLKRKV